MNYLLFTEDKLSRKDIIHLLLLIMILSGIFGFIYEEIFYYFDLGYLVKRGSTFGPWIPIYFFGGLLITISTYRFKDKPLLVFLLTVIVTGILEFGTGLVLDKVFNLRLWDYNTEILNFGNIGGFVCLRSVLFFGLSSLLLIYVMIPFFYYSASKMNKKVFLIISFSLCFIFLFDEVYNLIIARVFDLPRASDIYKKIGFKYMEFK